jgi:hypothetical protein
MPELVVGLLVGVWLGMDSGFDPNGAAIVGGVAALATYFASCVVWPYRRCWRCGGDDRHFDGHGNYRHKRTCFWCKGAKDNRRIGARLMGRG